MRSTSIPLWPYVWAMFRLAERQHRRSKKTAEAIVDLANRTWIERPPTHGFGLWQSSAWMSTDFLQQKFMTMKQAHKNLFAPGGPFTTRLHDFAGGRLVKAMRRRPGLLGEVFAENSKDNDLLRDLFQLLPGDLSYRGVVVLGFGVPKGVFWVGTVPNPATWEQTAEARALELYLPILPYPYRPEAPALSGEMSDAPWPLRYVLPRQRRGWLRCVAAALLDATRGQRRDERVLVLPRLADVAAARLEQMQSLRSVYEITEAMAEDAARFFPWLWDFVPTDAQPSLPTIPPEEDFAVALELVIVYSVLTHVQPDIPLSEIVRCHTALTGRREERLAEHLRAEGLLTWRTWVRISHQAFFIHSELRAWLWRVSEWMTNSSSAFLRARAPALWQGYDDQVAHELRLRASERSSKTDP